jgi:transcriptional regulator with XRE-family HTH domain
MGGIERGEHNLTIQTALTIAKGLDVSLSELFSGIERALDGSATPTS